MAYKKASFRILGDGINLLPPTDLGPESAALDCQNFRVDQQGQLKSREGTAAVNTAGAGPVRSIIKALTKRFVGSGTALFRDFVSVATGFDGEPLGFVDWKKWLWVMNRSSQVKDNGTNNRNWAITAPAAKCTAGIGTEYAKTIVTFDSAESWTFDGTAIPTGVASFDGSEKQEGTHSLKIAAAGDETHQIKRVGLSLDLSTYSSQTANDEDKHRIWIYASKFKKLDQITIKIDVSATGGAFTDYYEVTILRKTLKKAGKGWRRFEIRRAEKVDDPLPFFTRVGGNTARTWATVTAVEIVLDTRAAVDVRFDLWEVFGSNTAQIEGQDIQYVFTYANDEEHESNPSPDSDAVVINRTSVALSGLTASADGQVTKKYIYRRGGTLSKYMRVSNTGVANGTTTYTDTASDDDITALGMFLEDDNDPPPAARGALGPYLGRIVVYSTAAHPARYFWSKLNKPYAFPGSASNISGNWADVGDTDEAIVGATHRTNVFYLYKENTIWRVVGDPGDTGGITEITDSQVGLIGNRAVCNAGEVDYFQAKEGIYQFNGFSSAKISHKLDPIFKGQTTTLASGITIPPISTTNRDKACLEFINGRLYFSYPETGQSTPNITVVLDIETGRWFRHSLGFSALYYEGQNGSFLGGKSNGDVVELESGTQDSGGAISVVFHSRYLDVGLPDLDKQWEDLTIDHNTGGVTLTLTAYLNDGASNVSLGTISSTSRTRSVLQFNSALGSLGRNVALRITGSGSAVMTVYDMVLNYYVHARQAKSFDTDAIPLGGGKMTRVRQFRLDMDNAASVAGTVYSDQPGFALASRDTFTAALSTTRRLEPVVIDGDPRGFLHRLVLNGTDFRLYGCQALVQVIGTWLIGSKGEFYKSDPLDFGSERLKLFREIQVDCDLSGGTCAYTVETDQPGGALASRATGNISATSGEQSVKIRLPNYIKGRLLRLTLTPASGAEIAIYAIRVNLKMLGEPNATPWGFVPLPVEETQDAVLVPIPVPTDELTV